MTRGDSPELTDNELATFATVFSLDELFADDDGAVPSKKVCAGEDTSSDGSEGKDGTDDSAGDPAGGDESQDA